MNNTINMTEVFNSIDTRKAQALATIAKYSADDRAEASRIASLYDNCDKTSAKHLCDTADILQDRFHPTKKAPAMKQVEHFNIRIVNTGDKYGVNDCLTNDKAPMVEFYDSRFLSGWDQERGQFVSRYYVETLLDSGCPRGLCLDGGVPAWSVSAEGMKQVIQYIKEHTP